MTYTPGIPAPTDRPSVSQGQIRTNFTQLNTIFADNHYAFNDATVALRGKHRTVILQQQAADPATTAQQGALYTKEYSSSPNLYWRRKSSGDAILMTANYTPLKAEDGYTFLPGGLLLQWGNDHVNGELNTNINFPVAFKGVPYSISVTLFRSSGSTTPQAFYVVNSPAPTASRFTVWKSGGGQDFTWMAIGPA